MKELDRRCTRHYAQKFRICDSGYTAALYSMSRFERQFSRIRQGEDCKYLSSSSLSSKKVIYISCDILIVCIRDITPEVTGVTPESLQSR